MFIVNMEVWGSIHPINSDDVHDLIVARKNAIVIEYVFINH